MAADTSVLDNVCPALLTAYSELNRVNDPYMKVTPVGFLQALFDPSNRKPNNFIPVDRGDGHSNQVRIKYKQRSTEADASDDEDDCTAGSTLPRFEQTFTVEDYTKIKFDVAESEVRNLCSGASIMESIPELDRNTSPEAAKAFKMMNEFMQTLKGRFEGLRTAINRKSLTSMAALVGDYGGLPVLSRPAPPESLKMIKATDGSPVLLGINEWQQQVELAQIYGKPIVVGHGNFNRWNNAIKYGCCNNGGTDFGKMSDDAAMYQYYKDFLIDNVFGANQFLTLAPESVQFVSYLKNRGSFAGVIGIKARTTIMDPAVPGLAYDISIRPNDCTDSYTIVMGVHHDLWTPPIDSYKTGDRLQDTNGTLVFQADSV